MPIYHILFVRHGLSCANATMAAHGHERSTRYRDPELTTYGIEMSRARKWDLIRCISEIFGPNPYAVGSSPLIRAQQTAYHMLLENMPEAMKLNILPHIGEGPLQDDNRPYSPEEQASHIDPAILARYGSDARGSQDKLKHDPSVFDDASIQHRSNFESFIQWIQRLEDTNLVGTFFPRHKDDKAGLNTNRRAVVVSHSGFLRKNLGIKFGNNDICYVILNSRPAKGQPNIHRVQMLTKYGLDPVREALLDGCTRIPPEAGAAAPVGFKLGVIPAGAAGGAAAAGAAGGGAKVANAAAPAEERAEVPANGRAAEEQVNVVAGAEVVLPAPAAPAEGAAAGNHNGGNAKGGKRRTYRHRKRRSLKRR